jgi:hypothetical protein
MQEVRAEGRDPVVKVVRPSPSWEAPPGTVHEPFPADGWRLVVAEKRCRLLQARKACGAPAVAEMNRAQHGNPDNWWAYCPQHMFGRWIEDGRVWEWHAVPVRPAGTLPETPAYKAALSDLVTRVNGFVYAGDRLGAVVDVVRHLRADPVLAATLLRVSAEERSDDTKEVLRFDPKSGSVIMPNHW